MITSFVAGLLVLATPKGCWSFGYDGMECNVSAPLRVAVLVDPPRAKAKRSGPQPRVFSIDLDSDGAADFIVRTAREDGKRRTCFIDSKGPAATLLRLVRHAQRERLCPDVVRAARRRSTPRAVFDERR